MVCVITYISASMVHATITDQSNWSKKKSVIFNCLYLSQLRRSLKQFIVSPRDTTGFMAKSLSFLFSFSGQQKGKAMFLYFRVRQSLLLFSFIIAILIICGSMINLHGSFFFYKISFISVYKATSQNHELAGHSIGSFSKDFHQLSFPEDFR